MSTGKLADSFQKPPIKKSKRICRTCLIPIDGERRVVHMDSFQFSVTIRQKLKICVPEMNLETTYNPVVCSDCAASIFEAYEFKIRCLETERKLNINLEDKKSKPEEVEQIQIEQEQEQEILVENVVMFSLQDHNYSTIQIELDEVGETVVGEDPLEIKYEPVVVKSEPENELFEIKQEIVDLPDCHVEPVQLPDLSESEDSNKCYLCLNLFANSKALKKHLALHKYSYYKCQVCQELFWGRSRFARHMRTHTGEKPFKCASCDKAFAMECALKRHKTVHLREKQSCEICGKTFYHLSSKMRHLKTHKC